MDGLQLEAVTWKMKKAKDKERGAASCCGGSGSVVIIKMNDVFTDISSVGPPSSVHQISPVTPVEMARQLDLHSEI